MEKYYTPTIEEFHVGFECEAYAKKGDKIGWYKWDFKEPEQLKNLVTTTWHIKNDISSTFRVKYLDKEDIESLGFVWNKEKEEYTKEGEFTYVLGFNPDKPELFNIRIFARYTNYKDKLVMFDMLLGDIKNKSELKKILKQLKISE